MRALVKPVVVIVGLLTVAVKEYHTSGLDVPQAPVIAVYVAPTRVVAVLEQTGPEVSGVGLEHRLFGCANETKGHKYPNISSKKVLK